MTNIALAFASPRAIFATRLSSQAVYFIQTGGSALSNTYCTLRGRIKRTKCALFSIKCKGAVWKKKHSYEVNLLLLLLHSAFQKVTIAFLHTSITLDSPP